MSRRAAHYNGGFWTSVEIVQLRILAPLLLLAGSLFAANPATFAAPAIALIEASADATASIGAQREAVLFWPQVERDAEFRRMYRHFPSERAARGRHARRLPQGPTLRIDGASTDPAWLDAYFQHNRIAGLMVLERGRVRLERYGLGLRPEQRWTSFSVAKSVTSALAGIALQQGLIASLDDRLERYLPELAGSTYAEVTIEQLLRMSSGVRWNEDYTDPDSDVARMYLGACSGGRAHVLSYLMPLPREWPAGTHWNYNTAETDLLGLVVQRATGHSLARYLSQTVWKPWGMAADAYWLTDECDGSNTGGSGLSATLADYARFGQFMLEQGRIDSGQKLARAWLDGAFRHRAEDGAPERGYGYLWWTDSDAGYAAIGIFGQMLYVDPARQLVIAQLASWPKATSAELVAARHELVANVKRAIDAERRTRRD